MSTIHNVDELKALPPRSRIVVDGNDDVLTKGSDGGWRGDPYQGTNGHVWVGSVEDVEPHLPVTLIYNPAETLHARTVTKVEVEKAARAMYEDSLKHRGVSGQMVPFDWEELDGGVAMRIVSGVVAALTALGIEVRDE